MYVPKTFENPETVKLFVDRAERRFAEEVWHLAKRTAMQCKEKKIGCISLTGPTCAGKSTMAKRLRQALTANQLETCVISIDDYYLCRRSRGKDPSPDRGFAAASTDFDSVDTIDLEALHQTVTQLRSGLAAQVPIYDFTARERVGFRTVQARENTVFLFEGIQVLYPKVSSILSDLSDLSDGDDCLSIAILPLEGIASENVSFTPEEIRFYRRLVRDETFRGSSAEFTFSLWDGVRKNEEENIFPYLSACSEVINSTHAYEIHVLAPLLLRVLGEIKPTSVYRESADRILAKIRGFQHLGPSFLWKDSLYWEFVKGREPQER